MEDDLDTIPYPDLSLLKPDPRRRKFFAPIPIQTSRGCPFDCSFCSVTGIFGKILAGQWLSVGVAHYARKLNRMWAKRNRTFLRVVALLKPKPGAMISVDYREDVSLEL